MPPSKKPAKSPVQAAPPVEEASGVRQVEPPHAVEISKRLSDQNKAVDRYRKDISNPIPRGWSDADRTKPVHKAGEAFYEGLQGDTVPIAHRLMGRAMEDETNKARGLSHIDLYRSYKQTPHSPTSTYLKYLVHRISNINAYDDPAQAVKSDVDFMKLHQEGGAADKNGHLVAQDLHRWMKLHPDMPEALLAHKAKLHTELNRGVGLNIRTIGGEPYVALTRGLNSDILTKEHGLSSWSDLVNTGFGSVMHPAYVPLKSIWYSYQHGPAEAGGNMGHENEYLSDPTGTKYEAQPEDVKATRGHRHPNHYDNATDEELAASANSPQEIPGGLTSLLDHANSGPKTVAAVLGQYRNPANAPDLISTKHATREQALASPKPHSIHNPNLTTDDLTHKVLAMSAAGSVPTGALEHPHATAETARAIASQYVPDDQHRFILHALAASPLTPPDALGKVVEQFQNREATRPAFAAVGEDPDALNFHGILKNPNLTTEQADAVGRINLGRPVGPYSNAFKNGRYSAGLIHEMGDRIEKGYGQEPREPSQRDAGAPLPPGYSAERKKYRTDLDSYLKAKAQFSSTYNSIEQLGYNNDLDDDSIEALIDVAQKHHISGALQAMAHRQNRAPMSELSQLRVLRALDEAQASSQKGGPIMAGVLAQAKGLAPRTVAALALHHNPDVRSLLFRNKTIGPETLAQAWPQGMGTLDEYLEKYKNTPYEDQDSPIPDLARAIRDRKAYAQRRATEHLIRPWPKGLAKSEGDWFPLQLREWLSSRGKEEVHQGYYYRAPNLDVARQLIKDKFLPVEPTDEILDGQVVWAYPAKDAYYHQWEEDPSAGGVLIYLETDEEPIYHDSRVFWPHDVAMTTARIAGIRPQNLQKGERPFTKRDLDPSLGYSISSKPHQSGVEVLAHDHTGNLVGRAVVGPYEDGRFIPHIVKVDPAHQRKGIASAMYSHAEKVTGQKLHPSPMQSEAVEAMWAAPRKFGKSEIDPGPTFNGEKDYRPDEAGDPQFPFQGGSRKEHSEPLEAILPLPGTNLEPGEHRTALAQLGHDEHLEAVLAAACFLGKKPYDPELLRQGLAVWGSKERAALHSVGLADSERNLRALDAVVKLQGGKAESRPLHKSEPEGIRSVIPCNEDGKDTAEAILRGVQSGNVTKLALKGKHSAGSLAIRDPHTGKVWLVKGSGGKQSPAQGARDGSMSQSRREACFWQIANHCHLGGVVPRADCIIVNGSSERAAISLLGSGWKSLDERKRDPGSKVVEILTPYLNDGQIHRWSCLEYVVGSTDSHGANILVSNGGSVALIDHGASFAGNHWDVPHDTKSWIPAYLRFFAPEFDFKKLTPPERLKHMPRLGQYEDAVLKRWLMDELKPSMVEHLLRKYGADEVIVKACLDRLHELRGAAQDPRVNLSEFSNGLWAGTVVKVSLFEPV